MGTKEKTTGQSFWELVRFALIALAIVIPIRIFIVTPFVVSGSSMVPTFEDKDYLLADKISYELGDPKRDDVVIFLYPNDPKNNPDRNFLLRYFDPGKSFIKRVIGLPNETVDIKDGIVTITNEKYKDGLKLDQSYVKNVSNDTMHFELKADEYFVMGDNRTGSSDSRYWGAVRREFFEGKPFLRLLPLSKLGVLPGKYKQEE